MENWPSTHSIRVELNSAIHPSPMHMWRMTWAVIGSSNFNNMRPNPRLVIVNFLALSWIPKKQKMANTIGRPGAVAFYGKKFMVQIRDIVIRDSVFEGTDLD